MSAPRILTLALVLLGSLLAGQGLCQQQDFLQTDLGVRIFFVKINGMIGPKQIFQNVNAQVVVSHNPPERINPIQVTIDAQPALAAKNSFYWNSDFTDMVLRSDGLKSVLKPLYTKPHDICFYYMSPILYRSTQALTQRESERIRWVDTHAKPLRIAVSEGELDLKVQGDRVVGKIWMMGYDSTDNRPVRYVAEFEGREDVRKKPRP